MSGRELLRHEWAGGIHAVRGGLILVHVQSADMLTLSCGHIVEPWLYRVCAVSAGHFRAIVRIARLFAVRAKFDCTAWRLERVHHVHFQLEERRGAAQLLLHGVVLCVRIANAVADIEHD